MDPSDHSGSKAPATDGGYEVRTYFYDESPTLALVRAIAVLEGCTMEDVPPLDGVVDTDALNRLLRADSGDEPTVMVEIPIDGYTATVRNDGSITVREDDLRGSVGR